MKALDIDVDTFKLRVIARNPKTNREMLRKMATSKVDEIRMLAASNLNTPEKSLIALCKDKEPSVRLEAIANDSLSVECFDKLLAHKNSRWLLAFSQRTPIELFQALAKDEELLVRERVACNRKCPSPILKLLAKEGSLDSCIAANENCPKSLFRELFKKGDQLVLRQLAANPKCPTALLKLLPKKSQLTLRSYITGASTSLFHNRIGQALARNPSSPLELLVTFKEDPDEMVRFYLGSNPNCPQEILVELAADESFFVRQGVAQNPKATAKLLRTLSEDSDYRVAARVAENKRCPVKSLENLAKHRSVDIRRSVARSIRTPGPCLAALTLDKNKAVRDLALENPKSRPKNIESMIGEKSISPWIRLILGKKINRLQQTIKALLDEDTLHAKLACASHEDATHEALIKLTQEKNYEIVYRVMTNPNCTDEILDAIAQRVN